jgi:O-antigen/teichoic acid export membrane protein
MALLESPNLASLTHSRVLAKNVVYNWVGMLLPIVVAMIAIPLLVKGLGNERFGVLALSWVVLGYFGVFDFGLGRVITKMIGEKLGSSQHDDVPLVFWTGLLFLLLLGLVMTAILYFISPLLVFQLLKISAALQQEALRAFRILSASVIFIILTVGLRAVQEAYQKFAVLNVIRTINGVLIYLAPLALIPFTTQISLYVLVLAVVRFLVMVINAAACALQFPQIRRTLRLDMRLAKPMFQLGGWMSISNLIGPVMVYFDRFLLGAWISVAAVTFYVTPYEVVTKLLVIISAVVQVLFPAFSMSFCADRERLSLLYSRAIRFLLFAFFPVVLAIILFSRIGLSLWLTPDFAEKSTRVAQWLAIGIFLNAPGQIAYILLQAGGRPDLTAKLHLVETPLYLAALFVGVKFWGISGAAFVWAMRLLADTTVLLFLSEKMLTAPIIKNKTSKVTILTAALVFVALAFSHLSLMSSIIIFVGLSAAFLFFFLLFLVTPQERALVLWKPLAGGRLLFVNWRWKNRVFHENND